MFPYLISSKIIFPKTKPKNEEIITEKPSFENSANAKPSALITANNTPFGTNSNSTNTSLNKRHTKPLIKRSTKTVADLTRKAKIKQNNAGSKKPLIEKDTSLIFKFGT